MILLLVKIPIKIKAIRLCHANGAESKTQFRRLSLREIFHENLHKSIKIWRQPNSIIATFSSLNRIRSNEALVD